MHKEQEFLTGCGGFCGSCPNYTGEKQPKCPGCGPCNGQPFWGTCNTYTCAKSHSVDHCGACKEFPCDQFMNHYDPNNPEGQRNAATRAGVLTYRAKQGDEKTLTLIRKIGKL